MKRLNIKKYKYIAVRFVRYGIGGGMAAGVDILFLYLFTEYLHIHYLISQVLAFIISFFIGFFFQKYITFQKKTGSMLSQGRLFLLFQLIGMCINLFIMRWLVEHVGIYYIWAAVVAKGVVFLRNFTMNHLYNFK